MVFLLAAALASCQSPVPSAQAEAARLRASFAPHLAAYLEAIDLENRLVPETLSWLDGWTAQSRSRAASQGCRIMDRWAAAHFGPRVIHEKLRFDEYRSASVKDVQQRLLSHLRERYLVLHEYQRFAQAVCYSTGGIATPPNLAEFRRRMEAHQPSGDQATAILGALPR